MFSFRLRTSAGSLLEIVSASSGICLACRVIWSISILLMKMIMNVLHVLRFVMSHPSDEMSKWIIFTLEIWNNYHYICWHNEWCNLDKKHHFESLWFSLFPMVLYSVAAGLSRNYSIVFHSFRLKKYLNMTFLMRFWHLIVGEGKFIYLY